MNAPAPTGRALATTSFTFEGQEVLAVMVGSEPWFVLAHVCEVLGSRTRATRPSGSMTTKRVSILWRPLAARSR